MRRAWHATLFVLAAFCTNCGPESGSGSCFPTYEYHVMLDIFDAPRDSCILIFSSDTRSAVLVTSTLPKKLNGRCDDIGGAVLTPVGDVPAPDGYSVTPCVIAFGYMQERAEALRDFLGAEVLSLTVACGGQQVASEQVEPTRWDCAL